MNSTDKPGFQQFHLSGVKHLGPKDAYDMIINNEAVLIDVRTEEEILHEGIPLENVLYHPMEKIVDRLHLISRDQNIILVCSGGVRSTKVANLLNICGYPNVANIDGGFGKWNETKLPFEERSSRNTGGGCCGGNTPVINGVACCTGLTKKSCC